MRARHRPSKLLLVHGRVYSEPTRWNQRHRRWLGAQVFEHEPTNLAFVDLRLHEFETLDEARDVIGTHIDGYHHRPHSGLNYYRTPAEVAQTWDDALGDPQTPAA